MKINYEETPKFQRDFKKLLKKFKTLSEDLETAKRNAIEVRHIHDIDNQSVFLLPNFCSEEIKICKLKKFACKALKGRGSRTGIRVIYAFLAKIKKVVFIEIYFKGDKENEDYNRIREFFKFFKSR